MKALQLKIFFLTIIIASSIQNELKPDAENVCRHTETYEETVSVKVKKLVKKIVKAKCPNIFKKFSCTKEVKNWKMVDEPQVVQKSREVLKCCSGFKEVREDVIKCVPECPRECVHGVCTAPDQCLPGTAANAKSTENSDMESTTEEMEQRKETEKSQTENVSLMSEIIKTTNTDIVTEITGDNTIELTLTDEISDEITTTELNEKEISTEIDLNITTSAEEMGIDVNNNNEMTEEINLKNGESNSSKNLITEVNEMTTNSKFLKFEEQTVKPTEVFEKNLLVDDFTYLLYVSVVGGFLFVIALWITVKRRKRIKESQTEKHNVYYLKEPIQFSMENLLCNKSSRKSSKSAFSMWESEQNNADPMGLSVCNAIESSIDMLDAEPDKDMPTLPDLPVSDQSPSGPQINAAFI